MNPQARACALASAAFAVLAGWAAAREAPEATGTGASRDLLPISLVAAAANGQTASSQPGLTPKAAYLTEAETEASAKGPARPMTPGPEAEAQGDDPGGPPGETWVRVGVIVASRRGLPEDKPLRFAYQDGEKLERLLATVGQVEPANLFFLKSEEREDLRREAARAGARIDALKRAGRRVLLQFYYTGHGAAKNFHMSDGPLSFDAVKDALGGARADARVYVLDVCYGASFFTAKGFRTAPPLQLQMEMDKSARGEVTISSSAVDEQAYEVRTLGGSIFTSHWIMALRGAGDRNRDGQVTLFEAYNYAYDRTSGYSAETLARPQHPSFQIDLTGARDVMLARLLRSSTGILFRGCPAGNYNVLDLGRGHQIGELRVPDGEEFTLALEQGRYRVQYLPPQGRTLSADVHLASAGMAPLLFSAFGPAPAGPSIGKGPAEVPAASGLFAGDSRWRLSAARGFGWFRDGDLAGNFQAPGETDTYFGLGGEFEPPALRAAWTAELSFSPGGLWFAGGRYLLSGITYSRRASGQEPLGSIPDADRAAFPVHLRWDYDFNDFGLLLFAGRGFRIANAQSLSFDLGAGWLTRRGEGTRTVTRTLYDHTARIRQDMDAEGYRMEAGFGWWLFQPRAGTYASLGLGARFAPYFQTLDEPSPDPGVPALHSREAGAALSFIATLGLRRPAPRREP